MQTTTHTIFPLLILMTAISTSAYGQTDANLAVVDCNHGGSLPNAVRAARPGETIFVKGACTGPISITQSGITLQAVGTASVDGQGQDAITVTGASRVTIAGLQVKNGKNGIFGQSGAQLTLTGVSVSGNSQIGILLQGQSSVTLSGGSTTGNGLNGLDLEATSSAIINGSFASSHNQVFGINVNGSSSLTLTQAALSVSNNILGIQIGTTSSAFIADSKTTLDVSNNITTGLTIVSGSHMVAFGGTITTSHNGIHGISIDSKAGLDLDAAALVTSSSNQGDGVHLEEISVLTMFNTPAFSGAPGVTTLVTQGNGANGVNLETGSALTLINQATVTSSDNTAAGIAVDNGSQLTLIQSTVTGNHPDVALAFGSRATFTQNTFGPVSCDSSVLVRGDSGVVCPALKPRN